MKTPTWVRVIGIILIVFGGCNASKHAQSTYMPQMMEMQGKMMKSFTKIAQNESRTTSDTVRTATDDQVASQMENTFNELFYLSEHDKVWIVRIGYMGLFVSLLYVLSGAFLLMRKKHALLLIYAALVVNIAFSLFGYMSLDSSGSFGFMALTAGIGGMASIVFDLALLIVILSLDKSDYIPISKD